MRFLALSGSTLVIGALLLGGCAQKETAHAGAMPKCQVGLFSPAKEAPERRKPANGSVSCVDEMKSLQN